MARPIEATPVLYGKDAKRVMESVEKGKYDKKKAKFLKKCDETYRRLEYTK